MAKKWNDIRPLSQKELEELLPNDSDDEIQASHEMQDSDDEVEDNLEKDFSPSESEYEPGTSDVESTDSEQSYTGQRKRRKIVPLSQLQESESPEDNLVVDNGVVEDQNERPSCKNLNRQKTI
ncbi:hypothetical protein QE152_g35726 [Popillia japonica]|uniref:Uncharacterized protein n=1 Tax=Popillia japonica TaxID=7064 RepID=A0AAW1IF22_POPJA